MNNHVYREFNKALDSIEIEHDTSIHYADLAIAVAKLLKEHYGTHNYEPFKKTLDEELKIGVSNGN